MLLFTFLCLLVTSALFFHSSTKYFFKNWMVLWCTIQRQVWMIPFLDHQDNTNRSQIFTPADILTRLPGHLAHISRYMILGNKCLFCTTLTSVMSSLMQWCRISGSKQMALVLTFFRLNFVDSRQKVVPSMEWNGMSPTRVFMSPLGC